MQYLAILHLLGITLPADAELEISAPNHRLIAFLFTELTADSWNDQRNDVLRAGINDAQTNGAPATWDGFKPTLMTWAFVDAYFNKVIKVRRPVIYYGFLFIHLFRLLERIVSNGSVSIL